MPCYKAGFLQIFLRFIYSFERGRMCEWGERGKGRGIERILKQTPHSVQSPTQGWIPGP